MRDYTWIDSDDAPELTQEDLKRDIWSIDGQMVSEAEGRAAFAKKLKENSEKLSKLSNFWGSVHFGGFFIGRIYS